MEHEGVSQAEGQLRENMGIEEKIWQVGHWDRFMGGGEEEGEEVEHGERKRGEWAARLRCAGYRAGLHLI